jgi:predicted SAM-dependent methyltransferase
VLEHFSFHELKFLLSEVNRVLISGGEFLITVPDASIYIDAYLGNRSGAKLMKYSPAVSSEKPMDILNYIFYMDGHHKFMFDKENLALHCERVGFESCVARPFEEGLDLPERDYESLYMSCRKK